VRRPGVITVAPGARVADAIEAAGGALPGAEVEALNLALRLRDQDRVRVPAAGEATALLDVNRASAAELEALPGIGPVYAARVLASRDTEGAYPSVEALLERGVLPAHVFEQVRTLLAAR
jgi:competence protein ComEA